jgi:hypothetical protein
MDDAREPHGTPVERNRDAKERVPVREVGRAVDRVHVPYVTPLSALGPFLTHDPVLGEGLGQASADQLLTAKVVLGHQVDATLSFDPPSAAPTLQYQLTCLARQAFRDPKRRSAIDFKIHKAQQFSWISPHVPADPGCPHRVHWREGRNALKRPCARRPRFWP